MSIEKNRIKRSKITNYPLSFVPIDNPERRRKIAEKSKQRAIDSSPREKSPRVVGGKFTQEDVARILSNTKIHTEQSLWQLLNDNELLPPRGKNLLPSFEDLKDLGKNSSEVIGSTLCAAVMILNFASANPAFAGEVKNQKQIEWAEEVFEKIDPIKYLILKKGERGARAENSHFTPDEQKILAWNIFHEARGESEAGQMAVLLTTFNRMKSGKYQASAEGTVLQENQFSWTRDILKSGDRKMTKQDATTFSKIGKLVEQFTSEKADFKTNRKKLIDSLKNKLGDKLVDTTILEKMTHYHLYRMFSEDHGDTYTKHASLKTQLRIKHFEKDFVIERSKAERDPSTKRNFIDIGKHLFYYSN